jgi:hypothetical protein
VTSTLTSERAVIAVIRAEIPAAQQIAAADRHLELDRGGARRRAGYRRRRNLAFFGYGAMYP